MITDLGLLHMHNQPKRTKNQTFHQAECSIYRGNAEKYK